MSISSLSSLTQESNDDDIIFRKKRNKSHPQIGDIDSVKIGNTNYKISSSIHPDKRFDAEKRLLTSYNYFTTDSPTRSIEKSKYILMEMLDYDELKSYNPKSRNTIKKRMKKKKKGGTKKKKKVTIKPTSVNMSKYLKDENALDKMESGNLIIDLSRIRTFDNETPVNTILKDIRRGEKPRGSALKDVWLPRPYPKDMYVKSSKKKGGTKKKKTKKNKKLQRKKKGGNPGESDILNEIFKYNQPVDYELLIDNIDNIDTLLNSLQQLKIDKDPTWSSAKRSYKEHYNNLLENEKTIENLIKQKDEPDSVRKKYNEFKSKLEHVLYKE